MATEAKPTITIITIITPTDVEISDYNGGGLCLMINSRK
jgi:hypothetical protein